MTRKKLQRISMPVIIFCLLDSINDSNFHAVFPRGSNPKSPVTARFTQGRSKRNAIPGKLHRFTQNVGVELLTDHHGWSRDAFVYKDILFLDKCYS